MGTADARVGAVRGFLRGAWAGARDDTGHNPEVGGRVRQGHYERGANRLRTRWNQETDRTGRAEEEYAGLRFHCDWALHSRMDRAAAKTILRKFDAAHMLLLQGNIELHNLPSELRIEIDRISRMKAFAEELSRFWRPTVFRR